MTRCLHITNTVSQGIFGNFHLTTAYFLVKTFILSQCCILFSVRISVLNIRRSHGRASNSSYANQFSKFHHDLHTGPKATKSINALPFFVTTLGKTISETPLINFNGHLWATRQPKEFTYFFFLFFST